MSDQTQKQQEEQQEKKPVLLTASHYADLKGFSSLHRFAIEKMFAGKSYTTEEWDVIAKKNKLID